MSATINLNGLNAQQRALVEALVVSLAGDAPAKPARTTRKAQPKAAAKKRFLTKGNRKEFVKAHPWAQGLSTKEIATVLASGERKATKGWALGEGYRALVSA